MSIGDTLAEARRQAGLTVAQVSDRTRIRETIIRGIEQNDFSACGGDFYARGHIRSVASVVGVDPAPLIREYDEAHGAPEADPRRRGLRAVHPDPHQGAALAQLERGHDPGPARGGRLRRLPLRVRGLGRLREQGRGRRPAAATHSATPKPSAPASPSPTTSTPGDVVIQLTAVEDCWVFLTSTAGSTIYSGVLPAGSTQSWKETQPVNLRLGNPAGVVLPVNGKKATPDTNQPVTLSLGPAQKVEVSGAPTTGTAGTGTQG